MSRYKLIRDFISIGYKNTGTKKGIVLHHKAGTNPGSCKSTFFANNTSAHYSTAPGVVYQYRELSDGAYHCGNSNGNRNYVGIEMTNSTTAPDWKVSDGTMSTTIDLMIDVVNHEDMGKLVVGKNLFGHRDLSATLCPGPYVYARLQHIADMVNMEATPTGKYVFLCDLQAYSSYSSNSTRRKVYKKGGTINIVKIKRKSNGAIWGKTKAAGNWVPLVQSDKHGNVHNMRLK